MKTAPTLIRTLAAASLVFLAACTKNNPKRALTPEELMQRDTLQAELVNRLNRDADPDGHLWKAAELSRAATGQPVNLTTDQLRTFFQTPPGQSIRDIQTALTRKLTEEILKEQNILTETQAREAAVKQLPFLAGTSERIEFKTIHGKTVRGKIIAIGDAIIHVGSHKVKREDIPEITRMQLWKDEYEKNLQKAARDAQSRKRWAIGKFLPLKLQQHLPVELRRAGYLPAPDADETSARWLHRSELPALIAAQNAAKRDETIREFWESHQYAPRKTPDGASEWVPKSILRK